MGGCRCTYRNCTIKSDGSTHLFHYPVFDKVRCYQWLKNARKLEFLNLKLSQVQNRVVCQHHFTDDMFMNYKKEKLVAGAIPILDGPYCEPVSETYKEEDNIIQLDEIENFEMDKKQKKAVSSMIYGNFLANSDLMELEWSIQSENKKEDRKHTKTYNEMQYETNLNQSRSYTTKSQRPSQDTAYTPNLVRYTLIQPNKLRENKMNDTEISKQNPEDQLPYEPNVIEMSIPCTTHLPLSTNNSNFQSDTVIYMQSDSKPNQNEKFSNIVQLPISSQANIISNNQIQQVHDQPKIKILSQENITTPLNIVPTLIPVSPSFVLHFTDKSTNQNQHTNNNNISYVPYENPQTVTMSIPGDIIQLKDQNMNPVLEENPVRDSVLMAPKKECITEEVKESQENRTHECISKKQSNSKNMNKMGKSLLKSSYTKQISENKQESPNKSTISVNKNLLIPQDRIAAIQEKRKFNMKLRDIINDSLNNLEDQESMESIKSSLKREAKINEQYNSRNLKNPKIAAEDPEISKVHKLTIQYLDARLKRMEETLLNRIDTNSKRIIDLKTELQGGNAQSVRKKKHSVYTQTNFSEKAHKKCLFTEISRYLTPEANSLIYEELFLNEQVKNEPVSKRTRLKAQNS